MYVQCAWLRRTGSITGKRIINVRCDTRGQRKLRQTKLTAGPKDSVAPAKATTLRSVVAQTTSACILFITSAFRDDCDLVAPCEREKKRQASVVVTSSSLATNQATRPIRTRVDHRLRPPDKQGPMRISRAQRLVAQIVTRNSLAEKLRDWLSARQAVMHRRIDRPA